MVVYIRRNAGECHANNFVDIIVLLSGDGDFDLLLEKITKDYNVQAHVYGVPSLTAKSLVNAASIYHPVEDELLL